MADAVDAFRRISWLIFKWLLISVSVVIGPAVAIGGGFYAHNWLTVERHLAKVDVKVTFGKDTPCTTAEHPIFLAVINESGRTIEKVSVRLKATRSGRSTDLAKYHSYSDDKLIEPTEGWGTCWKVPPLEDTTLDPKTLQWGIAYKTISFRD
jgi:hypothetical protein